MRPAVPFGPRLATSAGQVGVGALRLAPQPLSRLLHTPAPALQIPMEHKIRVGSSRSRRGRWSRSPTGSASMCVWFHSWSTEDAAQMHRLLDLGVDGIVTDHIDILRDVLAERARPCDLHRCGS